MATNQPFMFEKLFTLVRKNAVRNKICNNPAIAEKDRDSIVIEASSTIIDVLKTMAETGKIMELIKYLKFGDGSGNPLITLTVKKLSGKLTDFYRIEAAATELIARQMILPVLAEIMRQSKNSRNKTFGLANLLSSLYGKRDMASWLKQMNIV